MLKQAICLAGLLFSVSTEAKVNSLANELRCLTENIYYESADQSNKGKAAVGYVTMNRVKKNFAKSICGVVYQPSQFSWTNDRKRPKIHKELWDASNVIAMSILKGKIKDPTNGALFFHRWDINPKWKRNKDIKFIAQIDEHKFYKTKTTTG